MQIRVTSIYASIYVYVRPIKNVTPDTANLRNSRQKRWKINVIL